MKPTLIFFAGKAGTGKTTMSLALSKKLSMPYLDYDTMCQPFLEEIERRIGLGDDDRLEFYRAWRQACYDTVIGTAEENIRLGCSVIVSAPMTLELRDVEFPSRLREGIGLDFNLLLCYMAPPHEKHWLMVKGRNSRRDEDFIRDREMFDTFLGAELPVWNPENVLVLVSGDIEANLEKIVKKIETLKEK